MEHVSYPGQIHGFFNVGTMMEVGDKAVAAAAHSLAAALAPQAAPVTRRDLAVRRRSRRAAPAPATAPSTDGRAPGRPLGRPGFQPMTPDERAPSSISRSQRLDRPGRDPGPDPRQILTPMGTAIRASSAGSIAAGQALAALAEMLAAALNPSCAGGDHAAIYLERAVVRWLMSCSLPHRGQHGAAGERRLDGLADVPGDGTPWAAQRDGWDVRGRRRRRPAPLTLYLTEEGHSSIRKAAELLGLGAASLRTVPADADCRMDVDALRQAVRQDRGRLPPFCVAASAGTVGTGAIDPLDALADLCADEDLWLHVDGAYGAVGVLDPTSRTLRRPGSVHSLTLDPHKWLSVPVECGAALIRDGALLRETFSLVPPYLRTEEGKGFGGLPWYSEYGFQQTRGFRALKLWSTLLLAGRDGLARHVVGCNALARGSGR